MDSPSLFHPLSDTLDIGEHRCMDRDGCHRGSPYHQPWYDAGDRRPDRVEGQDEVWGGRLSWRITTLGKGCRQPFFQHGSTGAQPIPLIARDALLCLHGLCKLLLLESGPPETQAGRLDAWLPLAIPEAPCFQP